MIMIIITTIITITIITIIPIITGGAAEERNASNTGNLAASFAAVSLPKEKPASAPKETIRELGEVD